MLSRKPHSITRLSEPLGISLTAVSQHLQILEEAGLVSTLKLGRVRTASVNQVRQPLYRSSLERWRRYERHLGPLIEALGPEGAASVFRRAG